MARSIGQAIARHGKALAVARSGAESERLLRELRLDLGKVPAVAHDVEQMLPSLTAMVARELGEFESLLREGCAGRGWRCDGQWPQFVIATGIDVEVQDKARTVRVGRTKLSAVDVQAVFAELERSVRLLIPTDFDAGEFLEELYVAYEAVQRASGPVSLLRAYREYVVGRQKSTFWSDAVAKSFIEVNACQFRARLSALLETGRLTTRSGHSLRLIPPLDPKDALFIYLPAERRFGFIGRIDFVSEA
jgi:hypothetical protein